MWKATSPAGPAAPGGARDQTYKEEPPPLVEKLKLLRLRELELKERRQQRWLSKAQAKDDATDATPMLLIPQARA